MLGPAVIVAAAVALQQPAVPVVAVTAAIAAAVVSNSSRSRTNRTSTSTFRWLRLALFSFMRVFQFRTTGASFKPHVSLKIDILSMTKPSKAYRATSPKAYSKAKKAESRNKDDECWDSLHCSLALRLLGFPYAVRG